MQLYYPQVLLAAIVLEIVGGVLFALGLASGALMLVRNPFPLLSK
jgi:uncharacterized membrane protein YphA (DoxX/SURF4 family)